MDAETILKNYCARKHLGLLPKAKQFTNQEDDSRISVQWIRQMYEPAAQPVPKFSVPVDIVAESEVTAHAREYQSNLTVEVGELQDCAETSFAELNAARRERFKLDEILSQQWNTVTTVTTECEQLKAVLNEFQTQVQNHVKNNLELSFRVTRQRQTRASGDTQEAILTRATSDLCDPQLMTPLEDTTMIRLHIAQLVEEQRELSDQCAGREPSAPSWEDQRILWEQQFVPKSMLKPLDSKSVITYDTEDDSKDLGIDVVETIPVVV